MIVTKEFNFAASHQLDGYDGDCAKLHGHNYKLEVSVKGRLKDGMVIDFKELSDIVKKNVISVLDHKHLNDVIEYPTAECILQWTWSSLKDKLRSDTYSLYQLKLWETDRCSATYNGEEDPL